MKEAVYILERNNEIFYVGKAGKPDVRLDQHRRVFGSDITMRVIEWVDASIVEKVERFYIGFYLDKGCKLVNKAKLNRVKWLQQGDYRDMDYKFNIGRELKARYQEKDKDWKPAVESFAKVVDAYNQLKDTLEKHYGIVRQDIGEEYSVELMVK